ncbi:MAG: ABC transporter substrate-binding protein [Halioglobus sp.]|nr:ABC transporter substrate-binding protein [Halioglobus sp.]
MSIRNLKVVMIAVLWLATAGSVQAFAQVEAAYDLVQKTTKEVMDVVVAAEAYAETDPERYYQQVQSLLDPLIDYRGFARKVMGPYASSDRYRSLDEAGRKKLIDQLDKFTEAMRSSLVRTYSKGLLAFGSSRIELVPPEKAEPGRSRVALQQLIYADRRDPYVVIYQMGMEKSGDWKLNNVIIESVNLGEIYRDQFLASAREQDGDLDAVIANWTTVVVDVDK